MTTDDPDSRLETILHGFDDQHQRFRARLVADHFVRADLVQLLGEKLNDDAISARRSQGKDARLDNNDLAVMLVKINDYQQAINELSSELERYEARERAGGDV